MAEFYYCSHFHLETHYLHIIFLICSWHSLIIMETFISLSKTSNKNVTLGLWHLQFSLQLAFRHNVLNDCVIIVLEKKKIDSLRWTNWQEGKNSAKTDLEGLLLDRNLLFFMVGFDIYRNLMQDVTLIVWNIWYHTKKAKPYYLKISGGRPFPQFC